ncbi:hypothetical protein WA026_002590 [Henosepilachna vigintioctopunctata]|uniref:Uncharacterized protein n=1 Tax=Henosepilachna vigintioctopunctata TaxID=420089 RepID=A0AAW1TVC0_9CUCU
MECVELIKPFRSGRRQQQLIFEIKNPEKHVLEKNKNCRQNVASVGNATKNIKFFWTKQFTNEDLVKSKTTTLRLKRTAEPHSANGPRMEPPEIKSDVDISLRP